MPPLELDEVLRELRRYREERGWTGFHTPKDLAIAVDVEASELLEHFLWRDGEALAQHLAAEGEALASEIADVAIYLLFLCDSLNIDLLQAVSRKHRLNLERHPVAAAHGRARPTSEDSDSGS